MPISKDLTDLDSQLKKTVISAESFKRGSSLDSSKSIANIHKTLSSLAGHTRKLVGRVISLEKTVNNNSRKITVLKNLSQSQSGRMGGENIGAKLPGSSTSNVEDNISAIAESVSSIAEILSGRKKLLDDTAAFDKRKAEQDKRSLAESNLEKRFDGLKRDAEKVIAPVKSILDRIIDFFVTVFLGRVVFKLLEWFGDPSNAKKVNSIIRFLGDNWPKLLSLYLVFGTSFGRFAKGLFKAVTLGSFKLIALIAKLAAAKKIRGARKVAGFLGGGKGKLLASVIGTGVALGGTYALTQGLKGGEDKQETQKFAGGGYVKPRFPTFSGGGFNFKGMMGGASLGSMFGPLGMLLGGSGKPQEMFGGFVSGEKGVDKVPAMLSDGEFVMSRGAVAKYGVDTLESMNAAGGGTNRPKMVSGTTYAQGGGYIGTQEEKKEKIKDPILEKRERELDKITGYSGGMIADRKEDLSQQNLSARLKRIEQQMQSQRALASGQGITIKGAGLGSNIGKGVPTTFMGREAIKVSLPPGGSYENEITLAGKRYFAMKRGNDVIYVSNFTKGLAGQVDKYGATNKSYRGSGGGVTREDKKNLPKTKIMMGPDGPFVGYLAFKNGEPTYQRATQRKKGLLENITNFFDPKGAKAKEETLNARTLRLTAISDLQDYRKVMPEEKVKEMLNMRLGPNAYSRAVNDLKAKEVRIKNEAEMKKQAGMANYSASNVIAAQNAGKVSNLGSNYKQQELKLAAAANKPKVKPVSPPPKPQSQTYAQKMQARQNAKRGGSSPSVKTPNFGATCPKDGNRKARQKILGIF
jgi:hypothetical protein